MTKKQRGQRGQRGQPMLARVCVSPVPKTKTGTSGDKPQKARVNPQRIKGVACNYLAFLKNDAGTRKTSVYAAVPSVPAVPAVPAEKIANANETAKTTGERVELVRLMEAAMRACDFWGDGEEARQAMRQDVLHYPPTMRGELLDYFNSHYPPSPDISKHKQDKRP